MLKPMGHHLIPAPRAQVRRTGIAAFIFAFLRPRDAKAASVGAGILTLTRADGALEVPLEEIEGTELAAGWFWSSLQIRSSSGRITVSGLSKPDAWAFDVALGSARVAWWRRTLAPHSEKLRSVCDRLAQLADPSRYVARSVFADLERAAQEAVAPFPTRWPTELLADTPEIRLLNATRDFLGNAEAHRRQANEAFVVGELARSKGFFDRVEKNPLTGEQRRAVVVDEDRNLVVAAAGSGKTAVIVAKAGWLIRKRYRHPSELLLLAFTKDARQEMEERVRRCIGDEAGDQLTVRTFHSLGMSIIGEAEGRRPTLAKVAEDNKALFDLLKGIVADLMADPKFSQVMLGWFKEHFAPYRSEHEFQTQGEYWDYVQTHEIRSLQGEKLKSYEECEIANFLYLNGVPYTYEAPYEHETATREKRQYQPDFHLTEAGIYIEHFALTASGSTPPFIDEETYLESMAWKRRIHAEHGTVLIETFSHEKAAGRLTANLEAKLAEYGVDLCPIPADEVFAVLEQQGRMDPFTRLVGTFLQHHKGAQLTAGEIARRAAQTPNRLRAQAFMDVFQPIFERYQASLNRRRQIDFHDMIGKATEHVESGRYRSPFGYILVDEFQDISPGKARLLKALLDTSGTTRLFAVGDDWQAVFRFAGSDIAIMRGFRDYFGASARVDLETTFRCADRIADPATKFVLHNPAQIRKRVAAVRRADGPCVHIGLAGEDSPDLLGESLKRIAADAANGSESPSVLLLGRYRHARPNNMARLEREHANLRLAYMTVHRAKGLEADYVVVLGLCSGKYGFPTEIADDPLLNLVLAAPEGHPNAEERRLFYVALTRARRGVFLLADGGAPSAFITEMINDRYDVTVFGRPPERDVACPTCRTGRLQRRTNVRNQGTFYGCSHYPYCEHTQSPCPHCGIGLLAAGTAGTHRCRDCGQSVAACPMCDGWLKPRTGRFGPFLGCSNYPRCDYTRGEHT